MSAHRHQLTTWESIDLLRERTVGRLCIIDHGYPLAIPINYQVVGGNDDIDIVVRTAPETLLGRYEGPGSLEVDDIDLDHGTAWSVIVPVPCAGYRHPQPARPQPDDHGPT